MFEALRIGHGYDIHRLKAGGRLMMGGVAVAQGISADAHSDGDVVIHAIVDALCGAAGLGDIGELFPNSDPKWKDAASMMFLTDVKQRLVAGGWRIINCDVTISAEKPKLKPFKPAMIAGIADVLFCPVNIKAGTNEGCDEIGAGRAVAAHAVVLLMRQD